MMKIKKFIAKKIIVVLLIFIFAFLLRVWNLNAMGRTWDEGASTDIGFKYIQLIKQGDFLNDFWRQQTEHPPLTRYIYGLASYFDIEKPPLYLNNNIPVFKYDITVTRIISVIFSSLAVSLVALISIEFISLFVGVCAGIILAMLPFFLGLSQLATLESILFFFFALTIYCYFKFLEKPNFKNVVITGVSLGFAVLSKYTNVLVIPIMLAAYLLFIKYTKPKQKKYEFKKNIYILLVGLFTFFILWPMPWFNLSSVLDYNYKFRILNNSMPDIEIFFGRLMHLPVFYYFIMFLITTPFMVLALFFLGAKLISDNGTKTKIINGQKWFLYSLIAWFCIPFIQSFYNFRHHGVRFIIEIYAPLSIIAAIGFDYILQKFSKYAVRVILLLLLVIYFLTILIKITPYYLDYYNEVVGGTKNVYEKHFFEIGWWGQGMKETGEYLKKNAKPNSKIAVFISPPSVFPKLKTLNVILFDPLNGKYTSQEKFDYVVVSYFHVLREGFDDSLIKKIYKLVYEVKVDGGVLVYIYKK